MSVRYCAYCKKSEFEVTLHRRVDQFKSDILDDHTVYLLCDECYEETVANV